MTTVRADFITRTEEIENYFNFVRSFVDGGAKIVSSEGSAPIQDENTEMFIKTLKANCFLLLYNLVESTMKNSIEAIFDDLRANEVSFDVCRVEVQRIAVGNLRKQNPKVACTNLTTIALHIITETFDKGELFSGNLDARRIRDVAAEYGFSKPRVNGDHLLTIKSNRNSLAHGDKSFVQIGRDYAMPELITMKDQVKRFLSSVLDNVQDYISNKSYLATVQAS